MTREQLTQQILESKRAKRLSFAAIADALDRDRVEHADGDRVRVTLEGKFLPYNW